MNYKLLFIIIGILLIGALGGFFVFKTNDLQNVEKNKFDLTASRKIRNITLEDFYYMKSKTNDTMKGLTMFYFYSECPHFTEDILIKDIQNNYYYLPEKNSAIVIHGNYEWTKQPPKDLQFHVYTIS